MRCPKVLFTDGQWEWTRMPFGLINAPSTFQRNTDNLLCGIRSIFAIGYIDDLCVFIDGEPEHHLQHLREVLSRLRRAGLQLKPTECELGQREVDLLGHHVSKAGIFMKEKRMTAIEGLSPPSDRKSLMSVMGTLDNTSRRCCKWCSGSPLAEDAYTSM